MKPVIALVGRPNVGKSTLFNRLTKSREAIVANFPGLTRDRKYGEGEIEGQSFIAIDTGGISGDEEGIDLEMAAQSLQAIAEANIVLFLVDAKDGLMPDDHGILDYLRKRLGYVQFAGLDCLSFLITYPMPKAFNSAITPPDAPDNSWKEPGATYDCVLAATGKPSSIDCINFSCS